MFYFIEGFLLSGGLIIAIGAQNAFILRCGLLRSHVLVVVLLCSISDALLLSIGVLGAGELIGRHVVLMGLLACFGGLFLFCYGVRSFVSAYRGVSLLAMESSSGGSGGSGGSEGSEGSGGSNFWSVVFSCLCLTYLNPHVYLDTVVIFGSISASLDFSDKFVFLFGAVVASFLWFFGLGFGASLLVPLFRRVVVWRILDFLVGLIMFWLSVVLFIYAIGVLF